MLSSPATGITRISVMTGAPTAAIAISVWLSRLLLPRLIHLPIRKIALLGGDLPGLDHRFPASNLIREEFGELLPIVGDHVETDRLELCLDVG